MTYIDGFVLAVPTANKQKFIDHANLGDSVFMELGAVRILECWGDDIPDGKQTDFRRAVQATQAGGPVGEVIDASRSVLVQSGPFLRNADEVGELIVGVHQGHAVALKDVAQVRDGAPPAQRAVWWSTRDAQGRLVDQRIEMPVAQLCRDDSADLTDPRRQGLELHRAVPAWLADHGCDSPK